MEEDQLGEVVLRESLTESFMVTLTTLRVSNLQQAFTDNMNERDQLQTQAGGDDAYQV